MMRYYAEKITEETNLQTKLVDILNYNAILRHLFFINSVIMENMLDNKIPVIIILIKYAK